MTTARIVTIEQHLLSDGTARITRLGRRYNFSRIRSGSDEAPECHIGITLNEARDLMADALRADVLEGEA